MKTPRTDASKFKVAAGAAISPVCDWTVVHANLAHILETELSQWRTVAHLLAQRLRSLPESGTARFPDARDRAALEEYDNLVEETKTL